MYTSYDEYVFDTIYMKPVYQRQEIYKIARLTFDDKRKSDAGKRESVHKMKNVPLRHFQCIEVEESESASKGRRRMRECADDSNGKLEVVSTLANVGGSSRTL